MNRPRVLLLYPNLQMVNLLPSNIASLSAYLKSDGVEVRLFDTTLYKTVEKSVDEIRVENMQVRPFNLAEKGVSYKDSDVFVDFHQLTAEFKPDVIGVSATDDTFSLGIELVSKVKKPGIHVIVGGVYPTFSPEKAISNQYVDSICIGDGEDALLELCRRLQSGEDIKDIKNLWVKSNGRIYRNKPAALLDIDQTLYEDFSIFEEKRFFRPMQGKIYKMIPVSIDRGCPYNCSFCAAPLKRKLYLDAGRGQYFRSKTVKRVLEELEFQVKRYKADYIYFNSETFFSRKGKEIAEFGDGYTRRIGLPFWCQTHVETITIERAEMLKSMNCDRISIGIEHGNEEFRSKMLKKYFSNEQAVNAFKIMEKAGIAVTVNNIIGFPDETRELAFDTVNLNRSIKADSINAFFFVPYGGTSLREYCVKKGYLNPATRPDSLMRSSILNMPQFSSEQISGLVKTFPLYVKMPQIYFDKIKIAERNDADGIKALAELRDIYFKQYFN